MIIDAKTGRPNPAHSAQVLIYMYAVPKALPEYNGMEFRGHIIYPDGNVQIPASGVDGKVRGAARQPDPEAGRRDTGQTSTQRLRVPLVRHHDSGLP